MKSIKGKTKSKTTRKAACTKKASPRRTSVVAKTKSGSAPIAGTPKKEVSISNLKKAIRGIKSNIKQLDKALGK
jgi:hypothetical protein